MWEASLRRLIFTEHLMSLVSILPKYVYCCTWSIVLLSNYNMLGMRTVLSLMISDHHDFKIFQISRETWKLLNNQDKEFIEVNVLEGLKIDFARNINNIKSYLTLCTTIKSCHTRITTKTGNICTIGSHTLKIRSIKLFLY